MQNAEINNYEEQVADTLRTEQQLARQGSYGGQDEEWNEDFDSDLDNDSIDGQDIENKIKVGEDKKRISAKKGKLANRVRLKIKKERFDGLLFYSTLVVALIKDSLDFFTIGVFGPAIALVVNPLLSILLWMGGSPKAETKLKRIVIVNLIESTPLLSILPSWSMVVIKIKIEQDHKVKRLERILKRLEK